MKLRGRYGSWEGLPARLWQPPRFLDQVGRPRVPPLCTGQMVGLWRHTW